jgi:hypothetical protein
VAPPLIDATLSLWHASSHDFEVAGAAAGCCSRTKPAAIPAMGIAQIAEAGLA